jgi:hypothetical protein
MTLPRIDGDTPTLEVPLPPDDLETASDDER